MSDDTRPAGHERDEVTHQIASVIGHAHDHVECLPLMEADAVRAWLSERDRQHDAEVAAKALEDAATEAETIAGYPALGRMIRNRAARILREAAKPADPWDGPPPQGTTSPDDQPDHETPECAQCGRTTGLTAAGGRMWCGRHVRGGA